MRGIIDALKRTRLDGLSTRIKLGFDADGKVIDAALLESTGNGCPVHHSLHPEIELTGAFRRDEKPADLDEVMQVLEAARAEAREKEAAILRGDALGPLHGLPLAHQGGGLLDHLVGQCHRRQARAQRRGQAPWQHAP